MGGGLGVVSVCVYNTHSRCTTLDLGWGGVLYQCVGTTHTRHTTQGSKAYSTGWQGIQHRVARHTARFLASSSLPATVMVSAVCREEEGTGVGAGAGVVML